MEERAMKIKITRISKNKWFAKGNGRVSATIETNFKAGRLVGPYMVELHAYDHKQVVGVCYSLLHAKEVATEKIKNYRA